MCKYSVCIGVSVCFPGTKSDIMNTKTYLLRSLEIVSSKLSVLVFSALLTTTLMIYTVESIVRVTGHRLGCPDGLLCYGQAIPPLVDISA